jgi:hypothetical protein
MNIPLSKQHVVKQVKTVLCLLLLSSCSDKITENNSLDLAYQETDLDMSKAIDLNIQSDQSIIADMFLDEKSGFGEDCLVDKDCARGLICEEDSLSCGLMIGCAEIPKEAFPLDERGCLVETSGMSKFSFQECFDDSECNDSPYGLTCIRNICSPHENCETDNDCKTGFYCYGNNCISK